MVWRAAVWAWGWVAFVVACAAGTPARGQPVPDAAPAASRIPPGRVALAYRLGKGVPECEDERDFRTWVKNDMGQDPFVLTGPPSYTLDVSIERHRLGFVGVMELRTAAGATLFQKELLARTCPVLLDHVTVRVTAVIFAQEPSCNDPCLNALRATLERERRERLAQEKATKERLRALEASLEMLRRKGTVVRMELTYAFATGVLMTANLTPNVGPGVWLGGEFRAGPLSVGLDLRVVLPAPVQNGPFDSDLSQYVALVVPCGRFSYFFGCAVGGGGPQLTHDSSHGTNPTLVGPLLQLGGRLGAEFPFGENRFAVRAWGEVLYSTPHAILTDVVDEETVYSWNRPDVSAFFGLALVVKFGNQEVR